MIQFGSHRPPHAFASHSGAAEPVGCHIRNGKSLKCIMEVMRRSNGTVMSEAQATPQRVLVVDDDPGLIALITDGLRMLGGYEVSVATDGATGLEQFYDVRPDCVVVDVRMPGLNGFQFVRALRGDAETAQTPIVVLSALAQDRDEAAGLLSGADAYLFKPARMADLLQALERAIQLTDEQRWQRKLELSGAQPAE